MLHDDPQYRLADALPILVMISGADGVVQFFNRRWYEFTGQQPFARDEMNDWQAFIHADDAARVRDEWYASVQRGSSIVKMRKPSP